MTDCPSCGRFVGPYDACPHCGATLDRRASIRFLKLAALALALGGLAFLWLLATRTAPPTLQIGQANAMMNLAYVRVEGRVTRPPSFDPDTDYLSFWLADDTGELRVSVYRDETREIVDLGRVPALGDRVAVEGTLRVREDFIALTLAAVDTLEISRAKVEDRAIGHITAADQFARVRVRGQVRAVSSPYTGLTLAALRDDTGEIELALADDVLALSGETPALTVGQPVEVIAPVSLYKDTPQLSLAHPADLAPLDAPLVIAAQTDISRIDGTDAGQWREVSGQVMQVAPFASGVKYTLDDGNGEMTLLLWQSVYDQLADPGALAVGATLRVQGEVAEYRGELEIVPELPADVTLLATPEPSLGAAETAIGSLGALSADQLGQTIRAQGVVRDAASFSQGFKFTLDDGSGQITLLTWLDVYDGIAERKGLRIGASVAVTGTLDEYENELQIIPSAGADVRLLSPGSDRVAYRPIESLTLADVGQSVLVEGTVTRTRSFGGGMRVFLDDGSGEVMVLLWQNVYERVPDDVDVTTVGTRLRVSGRVEEYEGTLEIVPSLPFDVQAVP